MKIIQSFWSKPFQNPYDNSFESRFMGGFPLKRYFIYTWALSVLRLKEHFKDVHLITDDFGKQLMIDALEFPYSSCTVNLNEIEHISSRFWCAGKLYVFSKIKEPFLHFDGDLILGNLFDKNIISKNIIAEYHYEDKPKSYEKTLNNIRGANSSFRTTPDLQKIINKKTFIYNDYNLGIIGGKAHSFFNDYAIESLKLLELNKNLPDVEEISNSFLNCFIEQFMFYNFVQSRNEKIDLCIEQKFDRIYDYQKHILDKMTTEFSFIHLHNEYKLKYYTLPEKWLKYYYRDVYDKINIMIFGKIIQ